MKLIVLFISIFIGIHLLGCQQKEYTVVEVNNPSYFENTAFHSSEDILSPKFERLKTKYRIDTVFKGEEDEFKRILLLRNWIKTIIAIDDFGDPYPGEGYVEGILDAALQGTGFHCGHYMKVQNGIMNAYGYVTRILGAGPGGENGRDGHHGINEIWSNKHQKWFLSDAKYDHHFEKEGIPLSALEIREEFLKNGAADIEMLKGPDRKKIESDPDTGNSKEIHAQTYTWIEYFTYSDMFTKWPDHELSLTVYEDDYFRDNTWIWDGKPHWAYEKPEFMIREQNRNAIEWTPNTIQSMVEIEKNTVTVHLQSQTPNFREYQMKESPTENWKKVEEKLIIPLNEEAYLLTFRAMNLANVPGPEHRISIKLK